MTAAPHMKKRVSGNRRLAKQTPKISRKPVTILGKPDPNSVVVACALLDNIARRLDVARASAMVCRLALSVPNTAHHHRNVGPVLQGLTAEELWWQVEKLDHITHGRDLLTTSRTPQGRPQQRAGGKHPEVLRVHVSRSTLSDIRYRLSLATAIADACHNALAEQNVEAKKVKSNIDVAAMLEHAVIALIERQIERIYAITFRPENGRVVVGVPP